ncbi:hypothetical protein Gohar_006007 [Gossypium harknessii]|uniref:Uncharacterized protein n=1 Tax=Gossypium harknessii TaxID=34285 RepID=A0A7J9ICB6_9ROSI|nr:hypothetical protein [Gossypium harknessii]
MICRSSGKVARDNATGHSRGVCSRVHGTHALSFKCDRERSIACFLKWIEAIGQTRGETKRCLKAIGSHDAAESVVKLGIRKDKLGSFKPEERCLCEKDHKEDVVDDNGNDEWW